MNKTILSLLLLLAGMAGEAQDTTKFGHPVQILDVNLIQPLMFSTDNRFLPGSDLPPTDTAKVWLLVADTAHVMIHGLMGKLNSSTGFTQAVDTLVDYGSGVLYIHMIPGYIAEVKRGDQWNESFWMAPVAYLDDKKHPLSTNFVVWDSKTRK